MRETLVFSFWDFKCFKLQATTNIFLGQIHFFVWYVGTFADLWCHTFHHIKSSLYFHFCCNYNNNVSYNHALIDALWILHLSTVKINLQLCAQLLILVNMDYIAFADHRFNVTYLWMWCIHSLLIHIPIKLNPNHLELVIKVERRNNNTQHS